MSTSGRICLSAALTMVVMSWVLHSSPQAQTGSWTPPKTPWGHPDLQGVYTNKDEANTPLERPAELSGRSAKDFTAADLAALAKQRQAIAPPRSPAASAAPRPAPARRIGTNIYRATAAVRGSSSIRRTGVCRR